MTCFEIRQHILANNEAIELLLQKGTFELNTGIKDLLEDNEELRKKCLHDDIVDGHCIYCGKEFPKDE